MTRARHGRHALLIALGLSGACVIGAGFGDIEPSSSCRPVLAAAPLSPAASPPRLAGAPSPWRIGGRAARALASLGCPSVRRDALALTVRDIESGAAIPGARAFPLGRDPDAGWHVSTQIDVPRTLASESRCAGDDGRIDLPAFHGIEEWAVVGDGHAWQIVQAVHGVGPEQPVDLALGGSVLVRVLGWQEDSDAVVVVGERPQLVLRPDTRGIARFENVPVGGQPVRVRRSWSFPIPWWEWTSREEVLASGGTDVQAGREAEVVLDARPDPIRTACRLTVRIHRPVAWGESPPIVCLSETDQGVDFNVRAYAARSACEGNGASSLWTVSTDGLPAGTYRLFCVPGGTPRDVRLVSADTVVEETLPAPVACRVQVLDAATGRPPTTQPWLWWHHGHGPTSLEQEPRHGSVYFDQISGVATVLVPPGPFTFGVQSWEYLESDSFEREAMLGRDLSESVVLRRGGALDLEVRLDGERYAAGSVEVKCLYPGGTCEWSQCVGTGMILWDGLEAGSYEFQMEEIPGFEAVPSRTVELRLDEKVRTTIDLVRRP